MAALAPGGGLSKGAKKNPAPTKRPDFIMGSRPTNMRAPLPGARIKPISQGAGTRNYAKQITPPIDPTEGPL